VEESLLAMLWEQPAFDWWELSPVYWRTRAAGTDAPTRVWAAAREWLRSLSELFDD
jgi:hypothetical protein